MEENVQEEGQGPVEVESSLEEDDPIAARTQSHDPDHITSRTISQTGFN